MQTAHDMLQIIKPPTALTQHISVPLIFLGGSIEMGKAENWQERVEKACAELRAVFLNPRRDDWDLSWKQEKENPAFRGQVEWELAGLERADLIVFYFAPGTNSPITLHELGLFARSKKVIVCCPGGYNRKGNVDITCERFGIPQVETVEELISAIRNWVNHHHDHTRGILGAPA